MSDDAAGQNDAIRTWYQEAWDHLPVQAQSHYVPTRFGKAHVIESGDPAGRDVMLIHGLNNNALILRPQLEALTDYHVLAVDLPNQPGLSAPTAMSLAGDDYPLWLIDVMDKFEAWDAAVFGLSLGGMITLKLAAFAPDYVERMALLSPAGFVALNPQMAAWIAAANLPFRSYSQAMQPVLERVFKTPGVEPEAPVDDAKMLITLVNEHDQPMRSPREWVEGVTPAVPLTTRTLQSCEARALVLVGERDVLFSAEGVVNRAQKTLPNLAAAEVVPDAGHAMTYEYASHVNARVRQFLADGT